LDFRKRIEDDFLANPKHDTKTTSRRDHKSNARGVQAKTRRHRALIRQHSFSGRHGHPHPKTGKLYLCNEANHEILVLNPDTLVREVAIPVGLHPHSCLMGGRSELPLCQQPGRPQRQRH